MITKLSRLKDLSRLKGMSLQIEKAQSTSLRDANRPKPNTSMFRVLEINH